MQYLVGRPKPVRDRKGNLYIVFFFLVYFEVMYSKYITLQK